MSVGETWESSFNMLPKWYFLGKISLEGLVCLTNAWYEPHAPKTKWYELTILLIPWILWARVSEKAKEAWLVSAPQCQVLPPAGSTCGSESEHTRGASPAWQSPGGEISLHGRRHLPEWASQENRVNTAGPFPMQRPNHTASLMAFHGSERPQSHRFKGKWHEPASQ